MIKNRLKHKAAGILAALLITTTMAGAAWADPLPEETTTPEEPAATETTETTPAETEPVETQAPVIPEETGAPTEYGFGLTPTGNMALQDDIEGEDALSIEFLTVTTRDNHTFYIVIEHTKNGNNVHFLNQVDDADLRALLSDEQVAEYFPEEGSEGSEGTEGGSGFSILGGGDTEPDPDENPEDTEKKGAGSSITMLLVVVGVVAAIGGGYYFLKIKPKKDGKINEDAEFEDDEEYEKDLPDENEDEESEESEEIESETEEESDDEE